MAKNLTLRKHVLVIGSDAFSRTSISGYLRGKGFQVAQASTEDEAIRIAVGRRKSWHAIIAEHEAGKVSAVELLGKIESHKILIRKKLVIECRMRPRLTTLPGGVRRIHKPVSPARLSALMGKAPLRPTSPDPES